MKMIIKNLIPLIGFEPMFFRTVSFQWRTDPLSCMFSQGGDLKNVNNIDM